MRVEASEAKAQLLELVRRAEAGEEVILTRNGKEVVRLAPVVAPLDPVRRCASAWNTLGSSQFAVVDQKLMARAFATSGLPP